MGKLNVVVLRYLSRDDFRVLTAVSSAPTEVSSAPAELACARLALSLNSQPHMYYTYVNKPKGSKGGCQTAARRAVTSAVGKIEVVLSVGC